MNTEANQRKQNIIEVFSRVAEGYDNSSMRFFPACADFIVNWLGIGPKQNVLDVACGTGVVFTAASQRVGPSGRITGIDLSGPMLEQAAKKAERLNLDNVEFRSMDAESLAFDRNHFDAVICSFGIFFLNDMSKALSEWLRVVRPGGQLAFSSFAEGAFSPLMDRLRERVLALGGQWPENPAVEQVKDESQCRLLLERAGAEHVEVTRKQFGYHLQNFDEWWEVCWNSGVRGLVDQFDSEQLCQLREHHAQEVQALAGDNGIWMDVEVLITRGSKPGHQAGIQ